MAVIGALGEIIFSVSSKEVKTFDNAKWSSSARYGEHDRHLNDTLLEFTGNDPDDFSFTMMFSAFLGVDPMVEIDKLLTVKRNGIAMRLVIGTKGYGKYRWVITKTKFELERFDNRGNLLEAGIAVTLKAYSAR